MAQALLKSDTDTAFVMTPEIEQYIHERLRVIAGLCTGLPKPEADRQMRYTYAGIRDVLNGAWVIYDEMEEERYRSNLKIGLVKKRPPRPEQKVPSQWLGPAYEHGVSIGAEVLWRFNPSAVCVRC